MPGKGGFTGTCQAWSYGLGAAQPHRRAGGTVLPGAVGDLALPLQLAYIKVRESEAAPGGEELAQPC